MAGHEIRLSGPDLAAGVALAALSENQPFLGHFAGEPVVLVRQGDEVFAVGATCTHYSGPLQDGLVVGDTLRCPLHHARFSLRTGEATGAPALSPVPCFQVSRREGTVKIEKRVEPEFRQPFSRQPSSVVIVGAGAAGAACAERLRTMGYAGPITLLGDEPPGPVDRPNLSKDYLSGDAPEEWLTLRPADFYPSHGIDLVLGDPAVQIKPEAYQVTLQSGRSVSYGALLLATGAEPRPLGIDGAGQPHVHRLRSLSDSRAIVAAAAQAQNAVVIGSSFIGLEVAASLRQRGLAVAVVGPETVPLERVLGAELGQWIQKLHEQHGVRFFLGRKPTAITTSRVELDNGESLDADLVVLGVGVSPRVGLAESAGLAVKDGIVVDSALRTSHADIYAAGDVARYPDPLSGNSVPIEHWAVAERQGQFAARSMLGMAGEFREAPFFWSQHYDVTLSYVGHAAQWDACEVRGDLDQKSVSAIYRYQGRTLAVATIGRDRLSLACEDALERRDAAALEAMLNE